MQYRSLQHQSLFSPPVTSTAECHFCFDPVSSFFLGAILIMLFSISILDTFWPGRCSSSSVISFCLLTVFMGFLWQESWNVLPFSSAEDHVLSELSTMTCSSWVSPHSMAHCFLEVCKSLHHDMAVIHEGEGLGGICIFRRGLEQSRIQLRIRVNINRVQAVVDWPKSQG